MYGKSFPPALRPIPSGPTRHGSGFSPRTYYFMSGLLSEATDPPLPEEDAALHHEHAHDHQYKGQRHVRGREAEPPKCVREAPAPLALSLWRLAVRHRHLWFDQLAAPHPFEQSGSARQIAGLTVARNLCRHGVQSASTVSASVVADSRGGRWSKSGGHYILLMVISGR